MNNPDNSRIKGKKQEPDTAVTQKRGPDLWDEPFETVIPDEEPFFETVSVRTKKPDKEYIDEDEIFRRLAAEDLAAEAEERARKARESAAESIKEAENSAEVQSAAYVQSTADVQNAAEVQKIAETESAAEVQNMAEAESSAEVLNITEAESSAEILNITKVKSSAEILNITKVKSSAEVLNSGETDTVFESKGAVGADGSVTEADKADAEETAEPVSEAGTADAAGDAVSDEETADAAAGTVSDEETAPIAGDTVPDVETADAAGDTVPDVEAADAAGDTVPDIEAADAAGDEVSTVETAAASATESPAPAPDNFWKAVSDMKPVLVRAASGIKTVSARAASGVIPVLSRAASRFKKKPVPADPAENKILSAPADSAENQNPVSAGPSKRKKPLIIAAASLAGLLLLSSGIFLASHRGRDTFFARTYLANQDISGKKPEDVAREIIQKRKGTVIVLTEKGATTASGRAEEFGYFLDEEALLAELTEAQDAQRHSTSAAFSSLVQSSDIPLNEVWTCDTDILYRKINSRNLKIKRIPSRDAALVYNENANRYVVTPEEYGNQFKPSDMQAWAKNALDTWFAEASSEDLICRLEVPESIYWKPSVLQDSPALHREADALNIYADSKIIYTFGSQEVPLEFSTFRNWLSYENGFLFWDTDSIESYVENMASVYDTRGIARDFTTTNGETVHFSSYYVDYGYRINQEKEISQLRKDLMSKTTVTREPEYYIYDKWDNVTFYKREGVDDLAGTYIEVSLSDQYVWFYKDGELIVETDCVTGNVEKEMETTPGMYAIAAKASPAVLRGGEGAGAYETPVNFWMPFNGGQGLHDATWRYYFGGNIYKTHGSHGCVNLPYEAAKTIYENCKKGMAVIVY